MGLVDHQHVERVAASGRRVLHVRVHVAQQPLGAGRPQPRHRHDDPREQAEGVGVQAVRAPDLGHPLAVDDDEVEAELLAHLVGPLHRQAWRTHDHHAAGPVPQQQFLDDQPRLDRLAQADVVGQQQVRPGRPQRAAQRLQLVGLHVGTRPER